VPSGDAEFIRSDDELAAFLGHLRETGTFAFDTEFIGEVAYLPRTCLIQLASSRRIGLVDPFAITDLGPLWRLVGDESVTTIVHAGASDLSPVRRANGAAPSNIIDIQVAAGFTGVPYPSSLAKLVDRFLQFPLPKGHTFTDWDARPLSASQMRYAADDVRYLPLLWELLRGELETRERIPWAFAETASRMEDPHVFDAQAHTRRASRGYDLTPEQESLLLALCVARDTIAQAENMPHRSTIPDGSLLDMVRMRPSGRGEIAAIRGMPRPVVARHGDLLVATLAEHPSEPVEWFRVRKRREDDPMLRAAIDAMLAEAHRVAEESFVAPQLVLARADIERFVRRTLGSRRRGEPDPPMFAPDDWRSVAFGSRIDAVAGDAWRERA
jgi:ribonuclease D